MKFEQLKNELDNGIFRRVYIFTGPEKGVMHKYIKRVGVTDILQNLSDALPLLRGKSLFGSNQILAIREGFEDQEYSKLVDLCGDSHRLVLLPETVDQRKKIYKDGAPAVVEFSRFSSEQLAYYVQGMFPDNKPGLAECRLISIRCNNDVLAIEQACSKLQSIHEPITPSLIMDLVTPMPEDRIFDLAEEVLMGRGESAFAIISELYQLKTAELAMIVLLYNHFKVLLQIQHYPGKSDFELSKITGLSPWVVEKKRSAVNKFRSDSYYIAALRKLYWAESSIKSGKVPPRPCFYNLIFELIKK